MKLVTWTGYSECFCIWIWLSLLPLWDHDKQFFFQSGSFKLSRSKGLSFRLSLSKLVTKESIKHVHSSRPCLQDWKHSFSTNRLLIPPLFHSFHADLTLKTTPCGHLTAYLSGSWILTLNWNWPYLLTDFVWLSAFEEAGPLTWVSLKKSTEIDDNYGGQKVQGSVDPGTSHKCYRRKQILCASAFVVCNQTIKTICIPTAYIWNCTYLCCMVTAFF